MEADTNLKGLQRTIRHMKKAMTCEGLVLYEYDWKTKSFSVMEGAAPVFGYDDEKLRMQLNQLMAAAQGGHYAVYERYVHPEDIGRALRAQQQLRTAQNTHCELRFMREDGRYIWCSFNRWMVTDCVNQETYILGCIRDVNQSHIERVRMEQQLCREPLTGLYNKTAAFVMIQQLIDAMPNHLHAMMIFDMDDFKQVNDSLGHDAGDRLLKDFAGILRHMFRTDDIVARYGGDEFVIFLTNIPSQEVAKNKAAYIVAETMSKLGAAYPEVSISVSAGISCTHQHIYVEKIFNQADMALYEAKRSGKGRACIYA